MARLRQKNRTRLEFWLCVLLLLSYTATATPAAGKEGTFRGTILSPGDPADGPVLAMFLNWSYRQPAVSELSIFAPEVWVSVHTRTYHAIDTPAPHLILINEGGRQDSYRLTNVNFTLRHVESLGNFGVRAEAAQMTVTPTSHLFIEPRGSTTFTSAWPRGDGFSFYHEVNAPHLLAKAGGSFSYLGAGTFHFWGVHLQADAEENSSLIKTGSSYSGQGQPYGKVTQRWAIIQAPVVEFRMQTEEPIALAMSNMRVGQSLITPDGVQVLPTPAEAAAPQTRQPNTLLLGVAIASAVGVGAWRWGRKVRALLPAPAVHDASEGWSASECIERAELHLTEERYSKALEWAARARSLAPTSARACTMEAFVLERLGRVEEALKTYGEASLLAPEDGEHDYAAARLAAEAGYAPEEVEILLARALAKSPALVEEAESEPSFLQLEERASFRGILGGARSRLDE